MWQDARPIYLQIRDLIVGGIIDGTYAPGDSLPSVRALAADREVNPLTVSKAYQELQGQGLIGARRGLGLFVEAGAKEKLLKNERATFIAEDWPRIRRHIDRLGLTATDLFARELA
ncbi:MAG: GntR family transcriptional regulator [Sphingomonadaceae bacterium]|nr:GntR family transcriptional regulator [Sphingomonadaceae bacterium]